MPQPRIPNEDHVARGTYRRDRHGSVATASPHEFLEELPSPPELLNDDGIFRWAQLGGILIRSRKMTERELPQLELACLLWQQLCAISKRIDRVQTAMYESEVRVDDQEVAKLHSLRLRTQAEYHKVLKELGCGNIARSQSAKGTPSSSGRGVPTRSRD